MNACAATATTRSSINGEHYKTAVSQGVEPLLAEQQQRGGGALATTPTRSSINGERFKTAVSQGVEPLPAEQKQRGNEALAGVDPPLAQQRDAQVANAGLQR